MKLTLEKLEGWAKYCMVKIGNCMILASTVLRYWRLKCRKSPILPTVTLTPELGVTQGQLILVPMESACTHSCSLYSYLAPFRRYGDLKFDIRQFLPTQPSFNAPDLGEPLRISG